jgi:alpha-galactosidase/6-phospho-beta-glucosidase family protein
MSEGLLCQLRIVYHRLRQINDIISNTRNNERSVIGWMLRNKGAISNLAAEFPRSERK